MRYVRKPFKGSEEIYFDMTSANYDWAEFFGRGSHAGVTTVAMRAKLERELYPPIAALLQREGLHVWEEATIRAGESGTRTRRSRRLAVGGRLDQRLGRRGQTRSCRRRPCAGGRVLGWIRPRVRRSRGTARLRRGYLAGVFSRLGLGYIRVSPTDAEKERDADPSPFIVESVRSENLARVRLRHLFVETWIGDEQVWFGGDRRGDTWAVTGTTSEWQICGQVVTGSSATWLSLLAESKSVGDAAARNLDAPLLSGALVSLGASAELILRERRHNGRQGFYSDILRRWSPADEGGALAELLAFARSLSAPRVGPHFEVRVPLWPHDLSVTESAGRREFDSALVSLRAVQATLNERLSHD